MEDRRTEQINIRASEVGEAETAQSFDRRIRKKQDKSSFIDKCPFSLDPCEIRRDSLGNCQEKEQTTQLNIDESQENSVFGCNSVRQTNI